MRHKPTKWLSALPLSDVYRIASSTLHSTFTVFRPRVGSDKRPGAKCPYWRKVTYQKYGKMGLHATKIASLQSESLYSVSRRNIKKLGNELQRANTKVTRPFRSMHDHDDRDDGWCSSSEMAAQYSPNSSKSSHERSPVLSPNIAADYRCFWLPEILMKPYNTLRINPSCSLFSHVLQQALLTTSQTEFPAKSSPSLRSDWLNKWTVTRR